MESRGGGRLKFECKQFEGGQNLSASSLRKGQNLSATSSKKAACQTHFIKMTKFSYDSHNESYS